MFLFIFTSFLQSRLKNIDQNSEQQMEVTVGNVTVIITDYKLLPVKDEKSPPVSPKQPEQVESFENNSNDKEIEKKEEIEQKEERDIISS